MLQNLGITKKVSKKFGVNDFFLVNLQRRSMCDRAKDRMIINYKTNLPIETSLRNNYKNIW